MHEGVREGWCGVIGGMVQNGTGKIGVGEKVIWESGDIVFKVYFKSH